MVWFIHSSALPAMSSIYQHKGEFVLQHLRTASFEHYFISFLIPLYSDRIKGTCSKFFISPFPYNQHYTI